MLLTVDDYRIQANNVLPRIAREYYNGSADGGHTITRNEKAFQNLVIRPKCLADVSKIDTSVDWFGSKIDFPIGVAPTAFHKMADYDGELATARGAAKSNAVMIASSWSTTRLEDVAKEVHALGGTLWFQLYVYKDMCVTESLIKRAEACGCKALVLTVDTPVLGRRLLDIRHNFSLPQPLKLANFTEEDYRQMPIASNKAESGFMAYVTTQVDSSLSWDTVEFVKKHTRLPLIVKGIMRDDDAREAVKRGVAGIIVSNHGGRQLDEACSTIEALPDVIRGTNNNIPVFLDGGIRTGRDIFKAISLGAKGVFIGRPSLWGLAAGGENGVKNVLNILQNELYHTMQLAGCQSLEMVQTTKDITVHKNYFAKL